MVQATLGSNPSPSAISCDHQLMVDQSHSTRRHQWDQLPDALRDEVERQLGDAVVVATTQPGGFTPGVAAVLTLANNAPVFVKAVADTSAIVHAYRHEALISQQLPTTVPAPRLRFSLEHSGWVLLCFDAIQGRLPQEPWVDSELDATMATLGVVSNVLTPSPIKELPRIFENYGKEFDVWRRLSATGAVSGGRLTVNELQPALRSRIDALAEIEERWGDEASGETMIHFDIRSDNLVIDQSGTVWVVDWSWPCLAAEWVDVATFLPTLRRNSSELQRLWAAHPTTRHLSASGGNAYLVALAGTWLERAANEPLAHTPHLREHQATCARATLDWLSVRGVDVELSDAPLFDAPIAE